MNNRFFASCPLLYGIDDFIFIHQCLTPRVKNCVAGEKIDLTIRGKAFFGIVVSGNLTCGYGSFTKGDCFGLCFALTGREHTEFIASVKTKIMLLPAGVFTAPCESPCPARDKLIANALGLLAAELNAERLRSKLLSVHGIRQRLCAYLKALYAETGSPYLTIPFNRNGLSVYLSLSRPSMSRELCALRDAGALEFDGRSVKILDSDGLC